MADVIGEVGGELFQYNREGWKFGAELRQRDLYQRQKMRIKQVDLYRDDIRELFDLTVGKMDKYIIVCLVMLSITMEMFFKGRNPVGTPSWLFWCWYRRGDVVLADVDLARFAREHFSSDIFGALFDTMAPPSYSIDVRNSKGCCEIRRV